MYHLYLTQDFSTECGSPHRLTARRWLLPSSLDLFQSRGPCSSCAFQCQTIWKKEKHCNTQWFRRRNTLTWSVLYDFREGAQWMFSGVVVFWGVSRCRLLSGPLWTTDCASSALASAFPVCFPLLECSFHPLLFNCHAKPSVELLISKISLSEDWEPRALSAYIRKAKIWN